MFNSQKSIANRYAVRQLPIALARLVATVLGYTVFLGFSEGTDKIFYVAFAATASLSGLCFRMSSSTLVKGYQQDDIAYSAERLLHAAILFLVGSSFKYLALKIHNLEIHNLEFILRSEYLGLFEAVTSVTRSVALAIGVEWVQLTEFLQRYLIHSQFTIALVFNTIAMAVYWWGLKSAYLGTEKASDILWERGDGNKSE